MALPTEGKFIVRLQGLTQDDITAAGYAVPTEFTDLKDYAILQQKDLESQISHMLFRRPAEVWLVMSKLTTNTEYPSLSVIERVLNPRLKKGTGYKTPHEIPRVRVIVLEAKFDRVFFDTGDTAYTKINLENLKAICWPTPPLDEYDYARMINPLDLEVLQYYGHALGFGQNKYYPTSSYGANDFMLVKEEYLKKVVYDDLIDTKNVISQWTRRESKPKAVPRVALTYSRKSWNCKSVNTLKKAYNSEAKLQDSNEFYPIQLKIKLDGVANKLKKKAIFKPSNIKLKSGKIKPTINLRIRRKHKWRIVRIGTFERFGDLNRKDEFDAVKDILRSRSLYLPSRTGRRWVRVSESTKETFGYADCKYSLRLNKYRLTRTKAKFDKQKMFARLTATNPLTWEKIRDGSAKTARSKMETTPAKILWELVQSFDFFEANGGIEQFIDHPYIFIEEDRIFNPDAAVVVQKNLDNTSNKRHTVTSLEDNLDDSKDLTDDVQYCDDDEDEDGSLEYHNSSEDISNSKAPYWELDSPDWEFYDNDRELQNRYNEECGPVDIRVVFQKFIPKKKRKL